MRELVKTCNFCNDTCVKKNLRDQIIEGILDGDTIECLLQEKDLSPDKAIRMCQGQEAAKKQRAAIQQGPSHLHESVAALKTHPPKRRSHHKPSVLVAEPSHIQQGVHNAPRIVYRVTIARR